MTIYKLKKSPKEGEIRKEGNYTYQFINGDWREIYYKDVSNYECWSDYDNRGREIHYKNSKGFEYWRDEKGVYITKKEFDKIWEKVE